ncbi:glycosyl transferase [Jaminaea rosea]|uniref:Glycosyl transferase n=1 Tax=Jaminaea rosea TaxID=1569628 RepID=A0A316UTP4_9BASI|nr:glycosyl transferase [Jaminaea rosea]PWN28666.1 glycosyl transferase [Jaminaea rosea]
MAGRHLNLRIIAPLTLFLVVLFFVYRDRHTVQDTLSYSTRPLWDKPSDPAVLLPHLHAEGLPSDDLAACQRHGWEKLREPTPGMDRRYLIDAVLFSTELDLLEIRLRELWDVVDQFVVVESTHTLMGDEKNLTFAANRLRFSPWESKIAYHKYQGRPMTQKDGAFTLANEMRVGVNHFIHNVLKPPASSLLLMADVDEIPSHASLSLLKACAAPLPMHLQMRNYVYSFEWVTDNRSWRAQLHELNDGSSYMHGKTSDNALADAGWHCSFCFRNLWEFTFKMKGASHADRLYHRLDWQSYLSPERIQRKICSGEDLFDMLPEAYTWGELIQLWRGATRSYSAVNLPKAVVQDAGRFGFLLPGGCMREA